MWTVLVTSMILKCFGEIDAHSVHLDPSPIAEVEEGNTLILHCSYNGSNTPGYINWYLNNDTFGLVIEASNCNYSSTPEKYEIDRYSISCHETKFNLSIANISKDKDDQVTWKCDTSVRYTAPPQKASTTIVVIDAGPADTKSGQFDEPKTSVVTGIVGVISAFIVIIAAAGYLHYRKRRNAHLNKINKDHHEVHLGDFHEVHHEDHDEDHDEDYDDDHKQKGTPRADGHACGK